MTSDPTMVMAYGMSAPAALQLVDQVDNSTPNVGLLMGVGFQATQAQALYDGITNGVTDGTPFVSVGFSPNMAAEIATLLQGVVGPARVAVTGFLCDGDSITQGANYSGEVPYPTYLTNITGLSVTNYGRAGYKLSQTIADYASRAGTQYNAQTKNTDIILEGTNDILAGVSNAGMQLLIQQYCALAQATGWQVCVGTIIPGASFTGAFETTRVAYNAWLRLNYRKFASWLIDFDSISVFNPPAVGPYYNDSLHPTSLGNQYMAYQVVSTLAVSTVSQYNIVPPTIQGSVQNGNTLTATTGYWWNYFTPAYTYQWFKDGVAIGGATASTYVVQAGDVGHAITVAVTDASLYAVATSTSPAAAATGSNLAPTMAATAALASQNGMPDGIVLGVVAATNAAYPQPTYTISDATVVDVDPGTGRIIYVGSIDNGDGGTNESPVVVTITATNSQGSAATTLSVFRWGKFSFTPSTDGTLAADGITTATRYSEVTGQFGRTRVNKTYTAGSVVTLTIEAKKKDASRDYIMMGIRNGGSNKRVYANYGFTSGVFTTTLVGGSYTLNSTSIVSLGNGWFRLSLSVNTDTDTAIILEACPNATNNVNTPTTNPALGCYFANQLAA